MEVKNKKCLAVSRLAKTVATVLALMIVTTGFTTISGGVVKEVNISDETSKEVTSVKAGKTIKKEANTKETEIVKEEIIPVATGIEVSTDNSKLEYLIDEEVDLDKIQVYLKYDNTERSVLSSDEFELSNIDTSTYGEKTISVKYENFTTEFKINVIFEVDDCEPYNMYSKTSLNVRKGPATTFDAIGKLSVNDTVEVTGICDNGWSCIRYKDDIAYVSTSYLSDSLTIQDCEPKKVYATTTVNVRKGPGTGYESVGKLSLNNEVKKTGTCGDWTRVEYKDAVAFVHSKYLSNNKITVNSGGAVSYSGNHMDTAAVAAEMGRRPGMTGRLYIPAVGLNVAIFNGWSQGVIDARDSAGTYRYGGGQMMIADHKNQGFSAIKSASIGTIAYINNGRTVQAYRCVAKGVGQNKATGVPYDLLDCNGNSLYLQNGGGIGMYTCNSHWSSITYTMWVPN